MSPLTKAEQSRGRLLLLLELRARDSPLVILDRLGGSGLPLGRGTGEGTVLTNGEVCTPVVPHSSKNQARQLTVPSH